MADPKSNYIINGPPLKQRKYKLNQIHICWFHAGKQRNKFSEGFMDFTSHMWLVGGGAGRSELTKGLGMPM